MSRPLIFAATFLLAAGVPEVSAQTRPAAQTKCQPTAAKPCPPAALAPNPNVITYPDPFQDTSRNKKPGDDDDSHTPKIQLDQNTTLGIGGLERKF